tara:strand:+ start:9893 stop:10390 length:498 start_codon:yes stop_codon:yes gene_type:complete
MTSKKSTKKKTTKTKVVSVGLQRDKNLEVSKVVVYVQGSDRYPIHWDGLNDKFYNFTYDPVYKKHTIEFNSIAEYEAEREDLIHSANGRAIGHFGFQVHIVTVAQQEEIDRKRKAHEKRMEEKSRLMAKAQEEVQEEVDEAEKQLEEAREKLGAVQLKSTSLNIG